MLVGLEIDRELMRRSWATAEEEGMQWNAYVLRAVRNQVAADNVDRAARDVDAPSRRVDPGE